MNRNRNIEISPDAMTTSGEIAYTETRFVVSPKHVRRLEEYEDRHDLRVAEARLSDPTEVPMSYDEARKLMGL